MTRLDLARAAHKLRYLVRDYPGDKESRRLIEVLENEVLRVSRMRVVPDEARWSYPSTLVAHAPPECDEFLAAAAASQKTPGRGSALDLFVANSPRHYGGDPC